LLPLNAQLTDATGVGPVVYSFVVAAHERRAPDGEPTRPACEQRVDDPRSPSDRTNHLRRQGPATSFPPIESLVHGGRTDATTLKVVDEATWRLHRLVQSGGDHCMGPTPPTTPPTASVGLAEPHRPLNRLADDVSHAAGTSRGLLGLGPVVLHAVAAAPGLPYGLPGCELWVRLYAVSNGPGTHRIRGGASFRDDGTRQGHSVRCSCGWESELTATLVHAEAAGEQHIDLHRPRRS